ncbi:MAG: adenylate/guanylate cyclase domain-containing protein [Arenicellales bacterium]
MAETKSERKVTVILATDVVGYSSMMEENEDQTLKNLKACRNIIEGLINEHHGRIFNTAGDSVLAEFQSAVEAVICASEFQKTIKERNNSVGEEEMMQFRIGVNMGDVVIEGDNLYGDGVNVTARLEALAQPGGICLSKNVYEIVNKKTDFHFNDIGEQKVKDTVVHAVDVVLDASQTRKLKTQSTSKWPLFGAIAATLILGLFGIYYFTNTTEEKPSIETASATSSKPSILVAPIKASGLSEDQEAFGVGITESMISTLSQYKAIRVLSSSTSYHVGKTRMLDAEIRDQYGVDFVIRGSIQVMGDNARLNLDITDLKLGEVAVSKKRDFNLEEIFKVQDDLSNAILNELQINMGVGSRQGKTWASKWKSIEDFTKFLNWRDEWRTFTKEGYLNSQRMLDELKTVDHQESIMYLLEAWQIYQRIFMQFSTDKEKDLERLRFVTNEVVELIPESPDAYAARALIGLQLLDRGCDASLKDMTKVEEIGSTADTLTIGARVYHTCGDLKKAIDSNRSALKLVPNDTGWFITGHLVSKLYESGQIAEIYKLIGNNIEAKDMDPNALAIFAFLEHQKGNKELAEEYLSRAKTNGFSRTRFERLILSKEVRDKTIEGLLEIGSLE